MTTAKFRLCYKDPNQPQPIWTNCDGLRDRGYDLVSWRLCNSVAEVPTDWDAGVDFVLIHQELLSSELVTSARVPIIILERLDGAQLGASRKFLSDPKVLGVIKNTTFADPEMHNWQGGRHQVDLYRNCVGLPPNPPRAPSPKLSPQALAKIELGYSYCAYERLQSCFDVTWEPKEPREFVYHFAGTLTYGESEVELHRKTLARKLQTFSHWPGIHGGTRYLVDKQYARTLAQSQVCVSPWGYGEACYRDYEALAAGCVVVKPDSSYVMSNPDIFRDGTLIPCAPDWSDLESVIERILNTWDSFLESRVKNSERMRQARRPETICDQLAQVFTRCLARRGA